LLGDHEDVRYELREIPRLSLPELEVEAITDAKPLTGIVALSRRK
jgi:hypothetical protein